MGESELKKALQREGEARIRGFWQDAEAAVSKQREEIDAEITRLRDETDRQLQTESTMLRSNLLFAAQNRALKSRLHAEAALAERLLLLASQLLPELARNDRAGVWLALSAELPEGNWTAFKVTQEDRKRAARTFPDAVIECDAELGGGLIATNADATICIDNSMHCRLLRAWPDLLPQLLDELRKRVDNDETAHTDTAC
jgi:vacuolar-type H+-ATPase subunit E/Vma4